VAEDVNHLGQRDKIGVLRRVGKLGHHLRGRHSAALAALFSVLIDILSDELYVPIRKRPAPWCRRLKRISTS
jgi:hypothetical protein